MTEEEIFQIAKIKSCNFWPKVTKTDYCWNWTASGQGGYGRFGVAYQESGVWKTRNFQAHRLSYMLENDVLIPKHLVIMHTCDNRKCVNPSHLDLGSHFDNVHDCMKKGRRRTYGKVPKLTAFQALELKILYKMGMTQAELAHKFNIAPVSVSNYILDKVKTKTEFERCKKLNPPLESAVG